jgi:hypothetical protein
MSITNLTFSSGMNSEFELQFDEDGRHYYIELEPVDIIKLFRHNNPLCKHIDEGELDLIYNIGKDIKDELFEEYEDRKVLEEE